MTACCGRNRIVATTIGNHGTTCDVEVVAFRSIKATFWFTTAESQYKAKGKLTFRITSACEIIEGRGQVTATNDWDKVLDAYENYVDRYIACLKRIASGDMDAMTQYAKLLEKAEELGEQLENASGSMTTKQVNRYTKINKKLLEAAANGFN